MILNKFEFPERHKSVWLMRKDGVRFLSSAYTINDPAFTRCDPPDEEKPVVEVSEKRKPGRPKKV